MTIWSNFAFTRAEKYAILAEIYSGVDQDAEHGATEHPGGSEWANGVLSLRGREYDSDVDQPNRASGYDPYCSECSASIFLNDRFYDSDDMGGPSG